MSFGSSLVVDACPSRVHWRLRRRDAGWDASDGELNKAAKELLNANVVQVARKESTGAIFEIWLIR